MRRFYLKPIFPAFFLLLFAKTAFAQREFMKNTNGQTRTYLFHAGRTEDIPVNLPLIIVLHENGSTAYQMYASIKPDLSAIKAAIVFPQAFQKNWICDSAMVQHDQAFIRAMISDMYTNFKINRNKVYLLTDIGNKCLAEKIKSLLTSQIASVHEITMDDHQTLFTTLNTLANHYETTSSLFTLVPDPEMEKRADSANMYRLKKRVVISFQPGFFLMSGSVKSEVEDKSYLDMSESSSYLGISVTSWINDKAGLFIDLSILKGPTKTEVAGESLKVEGGGIIPVTLGVKYNFFKRGKLLSYALLGAGALHINAAWGRIKDPSNINLNSRGRTVPHVQIGGGFGIRPSKRLIFGTQLVYFHSGSFESVGNITSVRGLNAVASIGYVIGANK